MRTVEAWLLSEELDAARLLEDSAALERALRTIERSSFVLWTETLDGMPAWLGALYGAAGRTAEDPVHVAVLSGMADTMAYTGTTAALGSVAAIERRLRQTT